MRQSYRFVLKEIYRDQRFRNEYDGHTIEKSLEQVHRLTEKSIMQLAGALVLSPIFIL